MSKKLTGNGLWESSRMMLPEHKEQLLQFRHDMKRKAKPMLDEQTVELLSQHISAAIANDQDVKLTLYDPFKTVTICGKIKKVDPLQGRLQIVGEDHATWVLWGDIVHIE